MLLFTLVKSLLNYMKACNETYSELIGILDRVHNNLRVGCELLQTIERHKGFDGHNYL